jgi:hypothetical protein
MGKISHPTKLTELSIIGMVGTAVNPFEDHCHGTDDGQLTRKGRGCSKRRGWCGCKRKSGGRKI